MTQDPGRDRSAADLPDPADDRFAIPELCTPAALSALVIAAELLALVVTLLGSEPDWLRFAVVSLFVQWCALGSAGVLCLGRSRLARMPPVLGGLCSWLLVVLVIGGFALLGELALTGALGAAVRSLLGMPSALVAGEPDWARMARNAVVGAVLAGMVLRYLFVQQTLRAREQSELRLRLQALQSRIRPHFLFNSMNIIASLIETDPETAETVVEDLSALFRASLGEAGNQVPLSTELDLCDRYVRIEQLRLGDRLRIHWDLDPVPAGLEIPLLTLQPLLENAIYHGIQPLPEGGAIEVALRIVGERVEFVLANPLPPPDSPGQGHGQGNRMALANIRSRLAVLYGPAARLDAGIEGERFVTRLSYPVARGGEPAADDGRS
jgi:two-component system sensor histidine kinase AlgZ